MPSWIERYRAGDRERVWHELRQLGGQVRDARYLGDAEVVVHDAMTRAKQNVLTLIERLREQGYIFGDPWNKQRALKPHAPPDKRTPGFVAWLEERWGPLPITARVWIETVGDVSLMGVHPDWPDNRVTDPLVVELEYKSWKCFQHDRLGARRHFESEYESWEFNRDEGLDDLGPFSLDVAPDALHKANISGGAPYGVLVPDASVDATLRYDGGMLLPFVEYLRLAFRCGGFPGLSHCDLGKAGSDARRALSEGLLDL